ncbi:MAG: TadE/TadG family type IV pilus assembly protein [Pirellulales bacterium]
MNDSNISKSLLDRGEQVETRVVSGRNRFQRVSRLEKICRLCRRYRRGAAAVEFAVVVPVFFLFVFGSLEFGRLLMVQAVITNAAREGARKGVLDGSTTEGVTAAVNDYLTQSSVSGATVTVTPSPPSSAGYGEPVTVSVTIPFDQVSWLPSPMFLGGRTMAASTVMRRESVE